jgi:hypothetical protein
MLFLAHALLGGQGASESSDWVSCVDSLELPTDSVLTSLLGASTTVDVKIAFKVGEPPRIELAHGSDAARREVLSFLKLARFNAGKCANRSIALVFTFVFEGQPVSNILLTRTIFQGPNHFTFYVRPRKSISDVAPPGPKEGRKDVP